MVEAADTTYKGACDVRGKTRCPECGSARVHHSGKRLLSNREKVQCFECRECGRKFSEGYIRHPRQRGHAHYALQGESEKMDAVTETKTVTGDINGILTDYHVKMKLNGYKAATVEMSWKILELLIKRGADLTKPETVKKVIAEQNWSGNRRRNVINSYNQLAKYLGISWEQPKNTVTRKIPFIPTEQEIDDLIAGCPVTLAVFLQILKETALRSGEAIKLKWRDVDLERRVITCNDPEKGSDSRQFSELSGKLLNMLAKYHKTTNTFLEQKPKTA